MRKRIITIALILGVPIIIALIRHAYISDRVRDMPAREAPPYAEKLPKEPWQKIAEKRVLEKKEPAVPKTYLPLRLAGISEEGLNKVAYIENLITLRTGEYRIGDEILGAKIIEILPGRVVLLRDTHRITLRLGNFYDDAPPEEWIWKFPDDIFIVDRSRLNNNIRDINAILSEAIPIPYIVNGKFEGFRLSSLKKGGIVNEAGFQEGDIVRSINGQRLDSLKKPVEIYRHLKELVEREDVPVVKIDVVKNGRTRTLTYRIVKD